MAGTAGQLLGGRYRLAEPVGKGGMGQVWRGYDETLEREVAVKELLLPADATGTRGDKLIARTVREARATARLHHPGIVAVFDVVLHDGVPWIVMEFVPGPSLAEVITRDGRLAWERVVGLGAHLADALAHAHAAGVVHRDLKPANVLLAGCRTVLTDFGIARILDTATRLTSTGAIIGTPQYMPPEQIEGEPGRSPVDLWSLGATLYHAVEGHLPFDGPTLTAVLAAILTQPVPAPRHAGPLAPVLMSLLTKAPGQRPNAAALAEQLAGLSRAGRPTLTAGPRAAAPPSSSSMLTLSIRPQTSPLAAVLPGHSGRVHAVAFSPDGKILASGCDQGVDPDGSLINGGHRVRLWNVATRTSTAALAGPQSSASSVAFSPDGTLLASGNSDYPVQLWRLGGRFRKGGSTLDGDTDVLSVAFSPDGATLATGSCHKTIRLWDLATRTCIATLTGHGGWVHSVAFSPDSRVLASGSADRTVRLWDTATRTCTAVLAGHTETVRQVSFTPDGATLASCSADQTIRRWDVHTLAPLATLTGDFGPVFCLAFGPGGTIAASGGADSQIRLWDTASWTCNAVLTSHSKAVTSVAFSPDGSLLASASHDRTVRLWQLR